ncbi:unnamed protein product [Linum tenue]|uniref:Inosine/uridine-preferring nucleoside hydrolase domain-containing protein n=1 Tax=Linum tenue TaxID=586396 RepID=A0AAV0P6J1_9ROSI|nr:unnamed protein product [Linum tenue]
MAVLQKKKKNSWVLLLIMVLSILLDGDQAVEKGEEAAAGGGSRKPQRILLDTDVDTDDFFALLYLLKLNTSDFAVEAVTISANAWSDAGHAVNHIYDILYMMDRDDVSVGLGGEGGVLDDGTMDPNVGGYLPLIEQGMTTAGSCRYRQAIPVGGRGRLDTDSNYGLRRAFLPQGSRRYRPLRQPTSQQVLIEKASAGPITILMTGSHTNIAIFLMNNPHLRQNIEHIYIMGGSVRSSNPGNLYTSSASNPYAEFNIFADPFAAYQVIHSGVPVTLVPLDATNTIPTSKEFFEAFEERQETYEAQYCFKSLKMARDTWLPDQFYSVISSPISYKIFVTLKVQHDQNKKQWLMAFAASILLLQSYCMWDSFSSGVAASIMQRNSQNTNRNGDNEFAEMEYMNITVVTSNQPYGIHDGSNPFFDRIRVPKFGMENGGIHSGHVQTGLRDPFCIVQNGTGKCQDGFTRETKGPNSVQVLAATRAKPTAEPNCQLKKAFLKSFLDVMNHPQQSGKFNFTNQFPYHREVLHKPDFGTKILGKPVVFDMDMSPGDFLALLYLLKVPTEVINLKAIIVSPTGWANAATIDVVYDLLHMMGRDDIPVGLGEVIGTNQSDPNFPSSVGGCKYTKAIPQGSGGFLDSDTLYGLARDLPRSPRRYTAEKSVSSRGPPDMDHPELRQPRAVEVWESVVKEAAEGSKITFLTNGPLTNLAKIILSKDSKSSMIQEVYVVGGHLSNGNGDKGNLLNKHPNEYAEMNMFLDPYAAKTVLESSLNITLIPLEVQHKLSSFSKLIQRLNKWTNKTPEALFTNRLLSLLNSLQQDHHRYQHMVTVLLLGIIGVSIKTFKEISNLSMQDTFLGEILGAVVLAADHSILKLALQVKHIKVLAGGDESKDGQIVIDEKQGKHVRALKCIDPDAYYEAFTNLLGEKKQSAVIGSFEEQKRIWNRPPK